MSQSDNASAAVSRLPLKALGLRAGMALQTRRLVEGASKKESQYFGAIESKGVMVGPLGPDGVKTELEEGEVCVVRGFTGQYEFSFISKVLQTFQKPFAYALLAYPNQVDATLVRQSMRTKTSWPTRVLAPVKVDASEGGAITVELVDISLHGAMIRADAPLAAVGGKLDVFIDIVFENAPTTIAVQASVCHNNRSPNNDQYCIGMAFSNLSQQDKLLLNAATNAPQQS